MPAIFQCSPYWSYLARFFRIVQHVVRFIQCLEFGFGFRVVGMQVRVELFGPFLVSGLDVLCGVSLLIPIIL